MMRLKPHHLLQNILVDVVVVIEIEVIDILIRDIALNSQPPIHIPSTKLLKSSKLFFLHLSVSRVVSTCG